MLHEISFLSDPTLVPFTSVSFIFRVAKWDGHLFILYYNNNNNNLLFLVIVSVSAFLKVSGYRSQIE